MPIIFLFVFVVSFLNGFSQTNKGAKMFRGNPAHNLVLSPVKNLVYDTNGVGVYKELCIPAS